MISVSIGSIEYQLKDLSESWLDSEIMGRRRDGVPVVVRVTIRTGDINMVLSTPDNQPATRGRQPTLRELPIFELWGKLKLDQTDFTTASLIAFLKRISGLM